MKYPEYKNSGIDWLGDIPAHWQLKPIKYVVDIDSEKLKDSENPDLELEYIDISSVDSGGNILNREKLIFENAPSRARRIVQYGDTILATVRTYLRAITQIDYESELPQICSTGFAVLRPVNIDARYLFYWVRSDYFIDEIVSMSVGVSYPAISSSEVGNLIIPITPIEEQKAIASFLDHQTTRIDQLIEKKKRLLELLDEQRQAIITNAVTKGINPDAPMKDYGIDWLGEVPEHWDVLKVKRLTLKIGSGKTPKGGSEVYSKEGVLFLRSQNIHFDGLKLVDEVYISEEIDESMANTRVQKNDLLLNITGASLGRVCLFEEDVSANVNQHVCIVRLSSNIHVDSKYMLYLFMSDFLQHQIFSTENGTSREGLNFEQIGNLTSLLPPFSEQEKIVDFIQSRVVDIDELKIKIQTAIDRLEEYRSSLITQAVTGKIDVRDTVDEVEMTYTTEDG